MFWIDGVNVIAHHGPFRTLLDAVAAAKAVAARQDVHHPRGCGQRRGSNAQLKPTRQHLQRPDRISPQPGQSDRFGFIRRRQLHCIR